MNVISHLVTILISGRFPDVSSGSWPCEPDVLSPARPLVTAIASPGGL